jgi:Zn-dependent protease with chaperone function
VNFFERQAHVRRMSARLVILFIVAVIAIVALVNVVVLIAANSSGGRHRTSTTLTGAQDLTVLIVTTAVTLGAIFVAATYRTLALRGGGGVVARELGGVLVPQNTSDPQLRRLRNVVEEIAIASGVPVPEIYVLPQEAGINAFAAGWSSSDAAVTVTQGALNTLNRAELQGVIAHEFSHVLNGDMRLNIRLIGLLFGILFLAVIGRSLTYAGWLGGGGRRNNRDNSAGLIAFVGIALLIVGGVGVFVGRLIKAAVSRQREYLADASAVQFTRQTSGIVGALAKIAGIEAGSSLRNPKREEVGHMLFGSGAKFQSLFATHPPLVDRIKALDPSFDPQRLEAMRRQWAAAPPNGLAEDAAMGLAPGAPGAPAAAAAVPAGTDTMRVDGANLVAGIAAPDPGAYQRAAAMIAQIPADVADRARNPATAVALVLGMLLSDAPAARTQQHGLLAQRHGAALADAVWQEGSALSGLNPLLRLPLAQLALPAVRYRSAQERQAVIDQVNLLIHADQTITAQEYCLSRLVYGELAASLQPTSVRRPGRAKIRQVSAQVLTLLAVVAQAGNTDPAAAAHAFASGVATALPGEQPPYAPPPQGVTALEAVWPALEQLDPAEQQRLISAVVAVIADDGVTTVTEMDLLRTIGGLLHVPVPL